MEALGGEAQRRLGPSAPSFLSGLIEVLGRVEASDAGGAPLGVEWAFAAAVALLRDQAARHRKLIFIGNGGSASIASHQAVDYWKNGGLRAIAFNDSALLTCVANDFGFPHVFEKPVEMFADPGDILIAISSSGQSENILRGVGAARRQRCHVITLSGFKPDNALRFMGDLNFYAPSTSYGEVEITHLAICHAIVDRIIEERAAAGT